MNFVPKVKGRHFTEDLAFQSHLGVEGTIWLLEFVFESTTTQKMLKAAISSYFDNFSNILLSSEVYVLAAIGNYTFQVFEIYRKSPTLNVIVMPMCEITNNKTEYLNKNQIWTRRKDLSGVHFQIGCIKNNLLVYKNNEVPIYSFHFVLMIKS